MVKSLSCASSYRSRILVVEDDHANRLLFSDYLTHVGFTVLALPDGLELEQHLSTFQPDLLLLDLGLPKIDGYHLLEALQAHPYWHTLPVVVVSGYAFADNQQRALALGACRYLVKPIRLKELVSTLHSVLATSPHTSNGVLNSVEAKRSPPLTPVNAPTANGTGLSSSASDSAH